MAMSAAERQRKRREKLKSQEPDKYEEKKRKHAEYMKNKRKVIGQLSATEQNKRRKQWREANTRRKNKKGQEMENEAHKAPPKTGFERRYYRTVLKKLAKMNEVIKKLKRENSTLKKRVYRQKNEIARLNQIQFPPQNTPPKTPLSKAEYFADTIAEINQTDKERVKKKVLENNVLSESLAHVYKTTTDNKSKQVLKNIASNDIVKKYKMKTEISLKLGLKGRIRTTSKTNKTTSNEIKKIKAFFIRDDVSRATPGKKDCLTYNKVKKQKRFLLNTMLKLHSKYKAGGGKASYTSFVRHKPFYVVHPKLSNRNTCVCIRHANLTFKAEKLKKLNVIKTSNLDDLVDQVTCNINSDRCMYLNCSLCKNRKPDLTEISNTECTWLAWARKEHRYTKKDKDGTSTIIKTKKYEKVVIKGTTGELIEEFKKDLQLFKKHYYNIRRQYTCYREAIDNLNTEEVGVIIDFSENFSCKLGEEIQAMHFGASKTQITLHTGVIYKKNEKPESFASISPCNDHDPGAIWAHLEPVFEYIKQKYPETNIVHMFSDGPSTQYKQKKAFFVFGKLVEEHNLHYGTWSYFESSHGKGAADGVGGTLKRILDQQIAFGRDVCNARNAFDILSATTKVKLFYVTDDAITNKQDLLPQNLIAIRGTMQIHQIVCNGGQLKYRSVSCFCGPLRGLCDCFEIKQHNLLCSSISSPIPGPSGITSIQTPKEKYFFKSLSNSDTSIDCHISYAEPDYGMSEKTKKVKGKGIGKKSVANVNKNTSVNDVIQKENKNPNNVIEIQRSCEGEFNCGISKKIFETTKNERKRRVLKPSHGNIKPKKRTKRKIGYSSSTSEDEEISKHSDSDIVDIISIEDSETDCEDDTYNLSRVARIEKEIFETLRKEQLSEVHIRKKGEEEVKKANEIILKRTNTDLKIQEEKQSFRKDVKMDEKETTNIDQLKDNEELSNSRIVKMEEIERSDFEEEQKKNDFQARKDEKLDEKVNIFIDLDTNQHNIDINNKDDRLKQIKSDCSIKNIKDWNIGDTIMGRYFERKVWKYYVGVVTHINKVRCLYTIDYYKTIKKNGDLIFVKPKKQDIDEVPYSTIVKGISLLKIKENPETFVLYSDDDNIYF